MNNWLREKRISVGLTQIELARKLGFNSGQFICNWERGISEPPPKCYKKLAKVLGVNNDSLKSVIITNYLEKLNKYLKGD